MPFTASSILHHLQEAILVRWRGLDSASYSHFSSHLRSLVVAFFSRLASFSYEFHHYGLSFASPFRYLTLCLSLSTPLASLLTVGDPSNLQGSSLTVNKSPIQKKHSILWYIVTKTAKKLETSHT